MKAFVVLGDRAVTIDELQAHAAARLARFKRPKEIEIVDDLPHSLTGKVARGRLQRERVGEERLVTDAAAVRITLLGKPGCHLCDDARVVIERVASDVGVGWVEVDITGEPELAGEVVGPDPGDACGRRPARLLAGRRGPAAQGADPLASGVSGSHSRRWGWDSDPVCS